MDILLLGSGGREHAIAVSLKRSPLCDTLYVAPGNGGTAAIAENVSLDIEDGQAVVDFAKEHGIGLVVIGPEAPLVAGVAVALLLPVGIPTINGVLTSMVLFVALSLAYQKVRPASPVESPLAE